MGLDMYLFAKKRKAANDNLANGNDRQEGLTTDTQPPINGKVDSESIEQLTLLCTWRKANQVHGWFVKCVQGGKDDGEYYYVSREQLQSLVGLCGEALRDAEKATSILPPMEGANFGSYENDEDYFDNLQYAVEDITRILDDPAFIDCDFVYSSWW